MSFTVMRDKLPKLLTDVTLLTELSEKLMKFLMNFKGENK